MERKRVGRNDPCPCGSAKKYKKCCLGKRVIRGRRVPIPAEVLASFPRDVDAKRFSGPRTLKAQFKNSTVRAIWNRIYFRRQTETFHEFIINVLKWTVGRRWYMAEVKRRPEECHIIMRWIHAWHDLGHTHQPLEHKPGQKYGAPPTGEAQELMALADDVYRLQLVRRLPSRLKARLLSRDAFQGVRYEIAIAAKFVRCGFAIDWVGEKSKRHCEFNARHKHTGETIAVETKSRHRPGTLHQTGPLPDLDSLRANVAHLYREALQQNPRDKPFAVFIDVNLPHQPARAGLDKSWAADIRAMLDEYPAPTPDEPDPVTFLIVTNFAWHYEGRNPAGAGEWLFVIPRWARYPIRNSDTFEALRRSLNNYGKVPKDE